MSDVSRPFISVSVGMYSSMYSMIQAHWPLGGECVVKVCFEVAGGRFQM